MVGYNPDAQRAGPFPMEAAVAGSAAGMVTRALISPLDVLKIRFQVNMHPHIFCEVNYVYLKIVIIRDHYWLLLSLDVASD